MQFIQFKLTTIPSYDFLEYFRSILCYLGTEPHSTSMQIKSTFNFQDYHNWTSHVIWVKCQSLNFLAKVDPLPQRYLSHFFLELREPSQEEVTSYSRSIDGPKRPRVHDPLIVVRMPVGQYIDCVLQSQSELIDDHTARNKTHLKWPFSDYNYKTRQILNRTFFQPNSYSYGQTKENHWCWVEKRILSFHLFYSVNNRVQIYLLGLTSNGLSVCLPFSHLDDFLGAPTDVQPPFSNPQNQ